MSGGIIVRNDGLLVNVDSLFPNLSLVDKRSLTFTYSGAGSVLQNTYSPLTLFNPLWAVYSTTGYSDGFIRYDFDPATTGGPIGTWRRNWWEIWRPMYAYDVSPTTAEFFLFDLPVTGSTSYGARVWDDAGKLTFDAARKPLKIVDVIEIPASNTQPTSRTFSYPTGRKYAVITGVAPAFFSAGSNYAGKWFIRCFDGGVALDWRGASSGVRQGYAVYIVVDVTNY